MARLNIYRELNLTDGEVESLMTGVSEKMQAHGIRMEWKGERAQVAGRGVNGECILNRKKVDINLELDFLASMFKNTIEKQINGYLDELS